MALLILIQFYYQCKKNNKNNNTEFKATMMVSDNEKPAEQIQSYDYFSLLLNIKIFTYELMKGWTKKPLETFWYFGKILVNGSFHI